MKQLSVSLADRGRRFLQIWALGWRIVGKTFVASVIISFFQMILCVPGWFISNLPFFQQETPSSMGVRFVMVLFLLLIYLPLTFYVAARCVGFCPKTGELN